MFSFRLSCSSASKAFFIAINLHGGNLLCGKSPKRFSRMTVPASFLHVESYDKRAFHAGVVERQAEILEDVHHPLLLRGGPQHLALAGRR